MRIILGLAALAATFAAAAPAYAQTASADGQARGVILNPLSLTHVDDLDFGTVVSTSTLGTVRIEATAAGARSVTGGVTEILNYPGEAGEFQGAGTPDTDVELVLTHDALLVSGPNSITVNEMYLDGGAATQTVTVGAGGSYTVYVGGEFEIPGGQPAGTYTGAYNLTAEYP